MSARYAASQERFAADTKDDALTEGSGGGMTTYPEPPDGSIVGWGTPLSDCHVRIDAYADDRDDPDEHWYEASDDVLDDPLGWPELLRSKEHIPGGPYLLTPTPLVETDA